MHSPAPYRAVFCAALAALVASAPGVARGQVTTPGSDNTPPIITIAPAPGTVLTSASLALTVTWCDTQSPLAASHAIRLNGGDVTASFTYAPVTVSGCFRAARSVGTVTLQPGDNALAAEISDSPGNAASESWAYHLGAVPPPPPVFTPPTLQPPPPLPALPPVGPRPVSEPVVDVINANPGANRDRSQCVTVSGGPGVAFECGDLRLARGLPGVVTYGTARGMALLYNSRFAAAQPILAANVRIPAAIGTPTRVTAEVYMGAIGTPKTFRVGGEWIAADFTPGSARRIAMAFDGSGSPSGLYAYVIAVTFWNGSTVLGTYVSDEGRFIHVNRTASPYGRGWWPSGVEQLIHLPNQDKIWIGADGSTRHYVQRPGQDAWVADAIDRPDSLSYDTSTGQSRWIRWAEHRTQIQFDNLGQHVATVNRVGRTTTFSYDSAFRLRSVKVPGLTDSLYRFTYSPTLITIVAPGGVAGQPRTTTIGRSPDGIGGFCDVDWVCSQHAYAQSGDERYLQTYVDRRGTRTVFLMSTGHVLRQITRDAIGAAPSTQSFSSVAEARGLAIPSVDHSAPANDHFTTVTGPRGVGDYTTAYLNGAGMPVLVTNAGVYYDAIHYDDPRFPGLVTSVVAHNGLTTRAAYDARGNLLGTTVLNPHGDGKDATTMYTWDSTWDVVTSVTQPEGEVTRRGIDPASGDVVWEQDHDVASTRAEFEYDPVTRQLAWVRAPGASTTERTHLEYGTGGNLWRVTSPTGIVTRRYVNAIGRDTLVVTPIDSAQQFQQTTRIAYDALDRDTLTITAAPRSDGVQLTPAQPDSLIVRTRYDSGGAVLEVARRASPDLNSLGVIRTQFRYDALGRKIREIAPDLQEDHYSYDLAGNLRSWRTRRGDTITMTYDALNRLLTRTVPATAGLLSDQIVNTYDPTMPALATVTSRYSQIGREYYPNGALRRETQSIASTVGALGQHLYELYYTYDRNGRRTSLQYPHVLADYGASPPLLTYGYDWRGNLASVGNITFAYDVAGRRDTTRYPNGVVEGQRYDAEGRLAHRWQWSPTYVGGISGSRSGNGSFSTDTIHSDLFGYDARGKIRTVSSLTESVINNYAGLGSLARSQRWPESPSTSNASTETYVADALGNNRTHFYNELGVSDPLQRYESGTGRHLGSDVQGDPWLVPGDSMRYDLAGNMTRQLLTRTDRVLSQPNGSATSAKVLKFTTLIYDAEQRLRSTRRAVARPTNVALFPQDEDYTEEIRYDALGRRSWVRTRYGSPTYDCGGCNEYSGVQRFLWDGDQLLGEIRGPATWAAAGDTVESDAPIVRDSIPCRAPGGPVVTPPEQDPTPCPVDGMGQPIPPTWRYHPHFGRVRYIHGTGIDAPLRVDRLDYGASTLFIEKFSVYPHANWRGLTDAVTFADGRGRPTGGAHPSVELPGQNATMYGQLPAPIAAPSSWMGGLLAQQRDASGLMYMRNRYYDPNTGRFTQEDPIGLAGGMNLYGFANGDPVNFSDPFGLCPTIICPEEIVEAVQTARRAGPIVTVVSGAGAALTIPVSVPVLLIGGVVAGVAISTYSDTPVHDSPMAGFAPDATAIGVEARRKGGKKAPTIDPNLLPLSEPDGGHTNNPRESTRERHEKGDERRRRDQGGEKGDDRRDPNPNKKRG